MNPIQANLHGHTLRCDGRDSLETMILTAIDNDYLVLGISSHSPLPFANDYAMSPRAESLYLEEMEQAKVAFEEEIELLIGLEWDLDTPRERVPFDRYDYFIGSVHQLHREGKTWAVDNTPEELEQALAEGFEGDWVTLVSAYYNAVVQNALRPEIDIVGHFDLIRKCNGEDRVFPTKDPVYNQIARDALQSILDARPNVVFEVNFGGMKRAGLKTPYPDTELLQMLRKQNARVTLQADAHTKEALLEGWEEALNVVRAAGFDKVYRLRKDRLWEKVPI